MYEKVKRGYFIYIYFLQLHYMNERHIVDVPLQKIKFLVSLIWGVRIMIWF